MHNTDTSIEDSDEEDAVGSHVLDLPPPPLPSKRPETFITSDHDVSVFRDIEAEVDEASDIVCNGGFDIGDMIVEHDETNDEEQRRIATVPNKRVLMQAAGWHTYHAPLSSQH